MLISRCASMVVGALWYIRKSLIIVWRQIWEWCTNNLDPRNEFVEVSPFIEGRLPLERLQEELALAHPTSVCVRTRVVVVDRTTSSGRRCVNSSCGLGISRQSTSKAGSLNILHVRARAASVPRDVAVRAGMSGPALHSCMSTSLKIACSTS